MIANPKFINYITGEVKWPVSQGYVVDKSGNALRNKIVPVIGDTMDRFGSSYGRYTSPSIKKYSFEQRSLPYIENPHAYHKYEVIKDFSELKNVIENWPDKDLKEEFLMDAKAYEYDIKKFETYKGKIAPAFDGQGGAIQWNLPISVEYLEDFGFLKEIK